LPQGCHEWNWFGLGTEGADVSSTIMLVCAVLISLGSGVLLAYGLCVAMFQVFRIHARQVASGKLAGQVVAPAQVAKG